MRKQLVKLRTVGDHGGSQITQIPFTEKEQRQAPYGFGNAYAAVCALQAKYHNVLKQINEAHQSVLDRDGLDNFEQMTSFINKHIKVSLS